MELKDIKLIIDLMKKNDLSVFQMEKEGFKILLKKNLTAPGGYAMSGPSQVVAQPAISPLPAPTAISPATAPTAGETDPADQGRPIVSPMVGTFYQAMSPEAPPYVKVGQTVTEDTVVCIIEAMKVMNEIKAETSGVITEIAAENGKPVQFGQALFRVK